MDIIYFVGPFAAYLAGAAFFFFVGLRRATTEAVLFVLNFLGGACLIGCLFMTVVYSVQYVLGGLSGTELALMAAVTYGVIGMSCGVGYTVGNVRLNVLLARLYTQGAVVREDDVRKKVRRMLRCFWWLHAFLFWIRGKRTSDVIRRVCGDDPSAATEEKGFGGHP